MSHFRQLLCCCLVCLPMCSRSSGQGMTPATSEASAVRVYPIGRTVADLPAGEDFTKPELAYATIHRHLASGDLDWRAVSVARLAPQLPARAPTTRHVSDRAAQGWMGARIVEVRIVSDTIAYVLAQWPQSGSVDIRCFELEGGRWLNAGNDQADSLEEARKHVDDSADQLRSASAYRKRTVYPKEYLTRFVEYLQTSGHDPKQFLLDQIAAHKLVIVGEIHHRPTYWKLNASIAQDPAFARTTGVIYLELPSNDQELVDRFLASETLANTPIIQMLRDNLWTGWPDQAMLDFFIAVWKANQPLSSDQRIRIVLVDMQRPWKLIREPNDWQPYDVDRNELMANLVLRDIFAHEKDPRHALFIVGYMHAAKNVKWQADGSPIKTAGWRLAQVLGDQCFVVIQHGPVLANMGNVFGRVARGLFDSAFRATEYKPVAFALAGSPFGGEPFDASADWKCTGNYQDGFDGYLFLERLEDEFFSPLIDGFYTNEFVQELDRRYRLQSGGKSLIEGERLNALDAKNFVDWMSRSWGQPRDWRDQLGPIDAWRRGTGEDDE